MTQRPARHGCGPQAAGVCAAVVRTPLDVSARACAHAGSNRPGLVAVAAAAAAGAAGAAPSRGRPGGAAAAAGGGGGRDGARAVATAAAAAAGRRSLGGAAPHAARRAASSSSAEPRIPRARRCRITTLLSDQLQAPAPTIELQSVAAPAALVHQFGRAALSAVPQCSPEQAARLQHPGGSLELQPVPWQNAAGARSRLGRLAAARRWGLPTTSLQLNPNELEVSSCRGNRRRCCRCCCRRPRDHGAALQRQPGCAEAIRVSSPLAADDHPARRPLPCTALPLHTSGAQRRRAPAVHSPAQRVLLNRVLPLFPVAAEPSPPPCPSSPPLQFVLDDEGGGLVELGWGGQAVVCLARMSDDRFVAAKVWPEAGGTAREATCKRGHLQEGPPSLVDVTSPAR